MLISDQFAPVEAYHLRNRPWYIAFPSSRAAFQVLTCFANAAAFSGPDLWQLI